jgi:hypothetical protein
LLSGASYLECIWYRVEPNSVYYIFWKTICLINQALNNLTLPTDNEGVARMVESWAVKGEIRHHGITTNFGTFMALDGFVIKIKKPAPKCLKGKILHHI